MPSPFIDDGYTLEKTFPANEFYDAVHVTYRPLLRSEILRQQQRVKALSKMDAADSAVRESGVIKSQEFIAECIAAQIVEWDIVKRDGNSVDVSAANVLRLEAHLQGELASLIWSEIPPDGGADLEESAKN